MPIAKNKRAHRLPQHASSAQSDDADKWPYDGIRRVATIGGNRRWQTGDNAPAAESFIDAKCGIVVQTRVKYRVSTFEEIPPQSALLETAHAPRFWRQGGGAQPVCAH